MGQGNQRSFAGWLGLLLIAQLLFLHLSAAFCARLARHHWAIAGIHDQTGWTAVGPWLWLVFAMQPGTMLLVLLQVGLLCIDLVVHVTAGHSVKGIRT